MEERNRERDDDSLELESLELMGIFLAIFGFIVTASVFIPTDWTGRIANLSSGGILLIIGIWSFLRGRTLRRR